MAFHQIVRITFEAEVKTHPQAIIEDFDLNAPKWSKIRTTYVKDDGLSRYTLQKTGKKLFVLIIEQLDLFGVDLGVWNEKDYPERENIIKETISEIERGVQSKITILKIQREVL